MTLYFKISDIMSAYLIIDHESFGLVFVDVVGDAMNTIPFADHTFYAIVMKHVLKCVSLDLFSLVIEVL